MQQLRTHFPYSSCKKILLHIINEWPMNYLLPKIDEEQCGFLPRKGIRDQIYAVNLIRNLYEKKKPKLKYIKYKWGIFKGV